MKFKSRSEMLEFIYNQYMAKNEAYGNNAHKTYCKFGISSYALRLSDKLQRYEKLLSNPDINALDESICDTMLDFVTYCLMCSGDITYNSKDPDNTDNYIRTCAQMKHLIGFTDEQLFHLANSFYEKYLSNGDSLLDVVSKYYDKPKEATPAFWTLMGVYMLNECAEKCIEE